MQANIPVPKRLRVDREVARERDERLKNDEARAGLSRDDDLRSKDARDNDSSTSLRRSHEGRGM